MAPVVVRTTISFITLTLNMQLRGLGCADGLVVRHVEDGTKWDKSAEAK